jgi:hypothetical protein
MANTVAAKKPSNGTSMVKWEEELARQADIAAAVTGTASGTFISFRGGIITVDKNPVPGNKLESVVLAHCFENAFYTGKYDPESPTPPVCFAYGVAKPGMSVEQLENIEASMAPHEKSTQPQHKTCSGCPQNEWGSADQGRGKACGNKRRLAIIPGDDEALKDATSIAAQKVYFAKTPVTSGKNWDGYVKTIAKTLRRPPLGVVTVITAAPDAKKQFVVNFDVKAKIDGAEQFEALVEKAKGVEIDFPYLPPTDDQPAAKKGTSNPAARKFAGKSAPARGGARR